MKEWRLIVLLTFFSSIKVYDFNLDEHYTPFEQVGCLEVKVDSRLESDFQLDEDQLLIYLDITGETVHTVIMVWNFIEGTYSVWNNSNNELDCEVRLPSFAIHIIPTEGHRAKKPITTNTGHLVEWHRSRFWQRWSKVLACAVVQYTSCHRPPNPIRKPENYRISTGFNFPTFPLHPSSSY